MQFAPEPLNRDSEENNQAEQQDHPKSEYLGHSPVGFPHPSLAPMQ